MTQNLKKLFEKTLFQYQNKKAIVFGNEEISYKELYSSSKRVGNALVKQGVKPNTRVAILMSNCIEYAVIDMGIIQAGATKVPLNDMLGEKDITYILQDSKAEVIFAGPNFLETINNIHRHLPQLCTIVGLASAEECPEGVISWERFQAYESETEVDVQPSADDMAMIMYTGGTTGRPKGVVHTQRNLLANIYSHVIELELLEDEKILLSSPLPHSAGFIMMAGLSKGVTHYIVKKFDPETIFNTIEKENITLTFMVPTMIYRLMDFLEQEKKNYDLSSLRTIVYGASPITMSRLEQGLTLFGPIFTQLYGQSEAPNFITRLRKSDHKLDNKEKLLSCGQPVMMAQVKIVNESGQEVPYGKPGEIIAKTPYNMIGYFNKEEITKETLKDGWLYTGDTGMMDEEGYVYLLDRKKDIIITGGLNVYTTEVENVIQKHPGVSQVAVIGIPHPDWGETITAFVKPKDGRTSSEDILAFCKRELSSYKCPKEIKFIESLPVTPYGKIDKKALRKPYWNDSGRNIN